MNKAYPRIALQVEKNRAHGRALLKGIADYALEHTDWRLELVDSHKLTSKAYVSQFAGLIVRVTDDVTAKALLASRKPVVDTYGRIDNNPIPSIRLDDEGIAEMAFRCFEEHHYHAFAYCGFPGLRFSDARGATFAACARQSGSQVSVYDGNKEITDSFFLDEKTDIPDAAALGAWLTRLPKPTAVFCCNDLRAVQVLNVCNDLGIGVPGDIAVLGVDDDVLLCTFTNPSLSSIATDPFSLGRTAAEMLHRQLERQDDGSKCKGMVVEPRVQPPQKVVERMSTDAYPFKTPWLADAMRYIRKNLSKGVTSDDVVKFVGYSHPKVSSAFVAEVGHPIKKEILLQRRRLACLLLRETSLSSAEISFRCGYQSPQYFSHSFQEEFKMTPETWRNQWR